jgi:hypothetical protein
MRFSIPAKYYPLVWLISISTAVRIFLALTLDLGNDEVYYHTYAQEPDWSHFDHPPMVGWVIRWFSLGLYMYSPPFMRAPAIIFAALSTWLMYELGSRIKNERTGWYAAILYTSSIYTSIIAGLFIMPDSPQVFFWVLALYLMADILPDRDRVKSNKRRFLLLGLVIGLAMLSKYTSVFLWPGLLLYLLFYNRNWFKSTSLYFSAIISFLVFLPVLIWNMKNHFISFTFHSDRVGLTENGLRFDLLGTELVGQLFYQNPVVYVLIWIAVVYGLRHHYNFVEKRKFHFLLFQSIPLILVFLFFSLFKKTLPHWTGPAYIGLMVIGAAFLSMKRENHPRLFPRFLVGSLTVLGLVIVLGFAQIKYGIIDLKKIIGTDITLDMYGWRQLKKPFKAIKEKAEQVHDIQKNAPIISHRWFPAAHLDYYLARPNKTCVLGWGSLDQIHKYAWMNQERGGFYPGMDAWYINFDNDSFSPEFARQYFRDITALDTISIVRNGETVKQAQVFVFHDLIKLPPSDFDDFMQQNE